MGLVERVKVRIKELMERIIRLWACKEGGFDRGVYQELVYEKELYAKFGSDWEDLLRAWYTEAELVCREDEELVPMTAEEKRLVKNWYALNESQKMLVLMQIDEFLKKR